MANVFPSQRNYAFSSSLLKLKFMHKGAGNAEEGVAVVKASVSGPALSVFEANRREIEARTQVPGFVRIDEEHSITRLYDLVVGRFSFKGMNPAVENALAGNHAAADSNMDDVDDSGKDISDNDMVDRYSSLRDTMGRKFNNGSMKRTSGELEKNSDEAEGGENSAKRSRSDNKSTGKLQKGRYFTAYSDADRRREQPNQRKDFRPRFNGDRASRGNSRPFHSRGH